jgi:hypothetical protein
MIKVIREIEEDWYLIQLEGTTCYQIWNTWELFEILIRKGNLIDEELLDDEIEFKKKFEKIKELREFTNNKQ